MKNKLELNNQRRVSEHHKALLEKESGTVLDKKKQLKYLAENQLYDEAERLYERLRKQQDKEDADFDLRKEQRVVNLLQAKAKKQENELLSSMEKIENGLNELEQCKDAELKKLMNRVSFLQRNIENLQIQEYNNFEKDVTNFNKDANIIKGSLYGNMIKSRTLSQRNFMMLN